MSAGSSGLAERRWFHKAPRLAAQYISKRFADIAPDTSLRFDSGFSQADAPCVLRPSKADAEFTDFTVLFDVSSWAVLAEATPSAESQILSAILAIGSLSSMDTSSVRQRCNQLGIPVVPVKTDDAPEPEPIADFHPNARENLQHDIFWDCSNDYGPVGNDTGADVLGLYRHWRASNDPTHRDAFFNDLVAQWQLQPIGQICPAEISKRLAESHYELLTWDDAVIGWAVSQIACDGHIDADVVRQVENAITRQSDGGVIVFRGWTSPDERLSTLKIVGDAIRNAPADDGDRSGD